MQPFFDEITFKCLFSRKKKSFSYLSTFSSFSVAFEEVKSFSDGMYTETEDEGFMAGPNNRSTINIGWLVGTPGGRFPGNGKSPHIDIYEAGQVKPPPYLNVKETSDTSDMSAGVESTLAAAAASHQFGYNLSRSKSVCDLSMEQNSQLLKNSEKNFTIDKKKVIEKANSVAMTSSSSVATQNGQKTARSRVVRNRTILGSFPLFYKLSQSLSSLNTKSDGSTALNGSSAAHRAERVALECGAYFHQDDSESSDR